jgi:TolA-binding protein
MSFLDKVAKAVGDAVDRGKKDVDQFIRIQKINSEIGGMESRIAELKGQIQQVQQQAGDKAIGHFRAGTLATADLKAYADQAGDLERQIAAEEAAIAAKKAEIEAIKAEDAPKQDVPPIPPGSADTPAVPPLPASGDKFCPACGAKATGGAFCSQCGAKLD